MSVLGIASQARRAIAERTRHQAPALRYTSTQIVAWPAPYAMTRVGHALRAATPAARRPYAHSSGDSIGRA
eukprot:2203229-Rhodomonas_salina.3